MTKQVVYGIKRSKNKSRKRKKKMEESEPELAGLSWIYLSSFFFLSLSHYLFPSFLRFFEASHGQLYYNISSKRRKKKKNCTNILQVGVLLLLFFSSD